MNKKELQSEETNSSHAPVRRAAVLGGGAWGTALAQMLARGGSQVVLQAMENDVVEAVNSQHENTIFLKGAALHEDVQATLSVREAVDGAELVLVVVLTPYLRSRFLKAV